MMHGVINVYKEKGFTSHDVVAKLRGIAGQKKIGHTGTLDPDAEGVLPVCLGKATKLCDMLTDKDKTYETVLLLGTSTDTQDITGEVQRQEDTSGLSERDVRKTVEGFAGEYQQVPPMYSALKVGGKKLYELAREGRTVERKARLVHIHSIRVLKVELPRVWMEVECSKGTYIRTLCQDIGEKLGCGGCMEQLLRTRVGRFAIAESILLSRLQELKEEQALASVLIPVDEMFQEYPRIDIPEALSKLLDNGNALPGQGIRPEPKHGELFRVYHTNGKFAAIYRYDAIKGSYQIEKMFFNRLETEESSCSI